MQKSVLAANFDGLLPKGLQKHLSPTLNSQPKRNGIFFAVYAKCKLRYPGKKPTSNTHVLFSKDQRISSL